MQARDKANVVGMGRLLTALGFDTGGRRSRRCRDILHGLTFYKRGGSARATVICEP